jgi:hypothetical protein
VTFTQTFSADALNVTRPSAGRPRRMPRSTRADHSSCKSRESGEVRSFAPRRRRLCRSATS